MPGANPGGWPRGPGRCFLLEQRPRPIEWCAPHFDWIRFGQVIDQMSFGWAFDVGCAKCQPRLPGNDHSRGEPKLEVGEVIDYIGYVVLYELRITSKWRPLNPLLAGELTWARYKVDLGNFLSPYT